MIRITILLLLLISNGILSQDINKPIVYFAIQTNDCVNCYTSVKQVFDIVSKESEYQIILNDILEDNLFGFISRNLSISPSIKKVEINDSLFKELAVNSASSIIIYQNNKIIYKKNFREINESELEKIRKLLVSSNLNIGFIPRQLNQKNLIQYSGNRFFKPYVDSFKNTYIFNNIENKLYCINKYNNVIVDLNKVLTDSFLKSYIKNANFISDTNKYIALKEFEETKNQMNRTYEVQDLFYFKNSFSIVAKVYMVSFANGYDRPVIIYPSVILNFSYNGILQKVYEMKWKLNDKTDEFLSYSNIETIDTSKIILHLYDLSKKANKIVELDFRKFEYNTPKEIISNAVLPNYIPKFGKNKLPNFYSYMNFKFKNQNYYYLYSCPNLFLNNMKDSIIMTNLLGNDTSNNNLFINKIVEIQKNIYVFYSNSKNFESKLNIYDSNFKFIKKVDLFNTSAIYIVNNDNEIYLAKYVPSKFLSIESINIKSLIDSK